MRYDEDGVSLWYGTSDAPAPQGRIDVASSEQLVVTAGMRPPSASNAVDVVYRVNGGLPSRVAATLTSHDPYQQAQYFEAKLPVVRLGDTVEYRVVARLPGHQIPGAATGETYTSSYVVVGESPPPSEEAPLLARRVALPLRAAR